MSEQKYTMQLTAKQMSLAGSTDMVLNKKQLAQLFRSTPSQHVKTRPAKGGGQWKYVTGTYVKKMLNAIFGWNWSFEIIEHKFDLEIGQAYVLGKLTCTANGITVVKMQFGRQDIKFRKGTKMPVDIGNDLKGAATDALKKCASELGVASDIYGANEFREIEIVEEDVYQEDQLKTLTELAFKFGEMLSEDDQLNVRRIIETQEVESYTKAINALRKAQKYVEQS